MCSLGTASLPLGLLLLLLGNFSLENLDYMGNKTFHQFCGLYVHGHITSPSALSFLVCEIVPVSSDSDREK